MLCKVRCRQAAIYESDKGQQKDLSEGAKKLSALSNVHRGYARDEQGSFALFGLFTFVIIIILAGVGIDIARHEALRSELQNTLDRAVLAATNLENTNDPDAIVTDYFAKAGLSQYLTNVTTTTQGESRKVTATVGGSVPTYFMKFASVDALPFSGHSTAEQGLSGLEISMVLDVSGSMNSYSRLTNLKSAAQEFTQTIFTNASSDEVSVSVIPYATQVNAGAGILGTLNLLDAHNKSHCINFEEDDFDTLALEYTADNTTRYYDQTMDFDPFNSNWSNLDMALSSETCAPAASREILPFSNDQDEIDTFINSLSAYGNTSIDLGVKWGAALLDSSAQVVSNALVASGERPSAASGHPAIASEAQKYLVVMTDGSHTNQYFIPDPYRDASEPTGVYKDVLGRVYVSSAENDCLSQPLGSCQSNNKYTRIDTGAVTSLLPYTIASGDIWELTWSDVWSTMTVYNHAYARYLATGDSNDYYDWRDATRQSYNTATKDARLLEICTQAKDNGVIIFAIGFEAPSAGQQVMQSCASSDAHYYDVDGVEISEAFSAIASKITELRLVE